VHDDGEPVIADNESNSGDSEVKFEIPQIILDAAAQKREFYYLLSTGKVVEGPQGSWRDRIGPYPTREAAAKALETARHRDAAWEAQSKAFREDK